MTLYHKDLYRSNLDHISCNTLCWSCKPETIFLCHEHSTNFQSLIKLNMLKMAVQLGGGLRRVQMIISVSFPKCNIQWIQFSEKVNPLYNSTFCATKPWWTTISDITYINWRLWNQRFYAKLFLAFVHLY